MRFDEFICGCASDELRQHLKSILLCFKGKENNYAYISEIQDSTKLDELFIELALHMFTEANWLEHGGTVRGSWLTKEGKEVVNNLEEE